MWQSTPIDVDILQRYGFFVSLQRFLDVDAELGLLHAGGNIGMGLRIDVRVDAQADRRLFADAGGDLVERGQFLVGLDVEHQDAGVERVFDFLFLFADSRKDDLLRIAAGFERAKQLAAGNDIEAASLLGECPQQRHVGIGLDGKTDDVRHSWQKPDRRLGSGA